MADPGPTANLPARTRRSGRAGSVWVDGRKRGEVTAVDWTTEAEQVAVPITGKWQDEGKPGGETRRGTFRYQDIDDHYRLLLWRFFEARRNGDRSAAAFPEFDLITKIADIGAPRDSIWLLEGCQLYQMDGGYDVNDDILNRDTPFTYRHERPLDAYEYGDDGLVLTAA